VDPAFYTAFIGLVGVAIGGLTSFATSWFIQQAQLRDKHREADRARREGLFHDFIAEASRLYGDALSHEKDDVNDMVKLYGLVAHMRLFASPRVIEAAEKTMAAIAEAYLGPNRTLHEMHVFARQGGMDFLVDFSAACRDELAYRLRAG
jgi:hypothetical protein